MVKKKGNKQKSSIKANSKEDQLFNFVLGIMGFFILEAIFMLGGLYFERIIMNVPATGIPSLLGMVVWSILACTKKSRKDFYLGGTAISILVPIILIIVTLTSFVQFNKVMYASIAGFIILEVATALWLTKKK